MIRLKILLFIGTIALLVVGGNGVYESMRFREPTVLTYEEFVRQKPTAGWFRVKGAALNIIEETHFHAKNKPDDLAAITQSFVPAYNAKKTSDEGEKEPVILLVLTRAPDVIDTIHEAGSLLNDKSDPDKVMEYLTKNANRLYVKRDVEGMVRSGLSSLSSEENSELKKNNPTLDANFITLEEGRKPSPAAGIGMLGLGVLLLVGQFLYYIGQRGR